MLIPASAIIMILANDPIGLKGGAGGLHHESEPADEPHISPTMIPINAIAESGRSPVKSLSTEDGSAILANS